MINIFSSQYFNKLHQKKIVLKKNKLFIYEYNDNNGIMIMTRSIMIMQNSYLQFSSKLFLKTASKYFECKKLQTD